MLQPVESTEALEKERARHKFMIQSAVADNEDKGVEEFWKYVLQSDVMDSKLKVRKFWCQDERIFLHRILQVVFENLVSNSSTNGDATAHATMHTANETRALHHDLQNTTVASTAQRRTGSSDETRKAAEPKQNNVRRRRANARSQFTPFSGAIGSRSPKAHRRQFLSHVSSSRASGTSTPSSAILRAARAFFSSNSTLPLATQINRPVSRSYSLFSSHWPPYSSASSSESFCERRRPACKQIGSCLVCFAFCKRATIQFIPHTIMKNCIRPLL